MHISPENSSISSHLDPISPYLLETRRSLALRSAVRPPPARPHPAAAARGGARPAWRSRAAARAAVAGGCGHRHRSRRGCRRVGAPDARGAPAALSARRAMGDKGHRHSGAPPPLDRPRPAAAAARRSGGRATRAGYPYAQPPTPQTSWARARVQGRPPRLLPGIASGDSSVTATGLRRISAHHRACRRRQRAPARSTSTERDERPERWLPCLGAIPTRV